MSRYLPWTLLLVVGVAGCDGSGTVGPASDDADTGPMPMSAGPVVNGYLLTSQQQTWMQYVADHVVADLPGTRDRQIQIASRAAWWSLKEGIFDTKNAPAYSLCNFSSGDRLIGLLNTCTAHRAWQVGLAAVQVPNHTVAELEALANQLYPQNSLAEVLGAAAAEAGVTAGSATDKAIRSSQGSLRASWLLRNSAIGFTAVERNEVVAECITGSKSWCYGRGWTATARYAPTKAAALRAIANIATLLTQMTAAPATPWIGSSCQTDADCPYSSNGAQGLCHGYLVGDGSAAGFCSLPCEGYCPDRAGSAKTFCVASDAGGGLCAVVAGAANSNCTNLPGMQPVQMARYVGSSGVPAATATVCAN